MIIEIVKVPAGPAPEEFRKEWIGVRMKAERMPAEDGIIGTPTVEVDFISGEQRPSRGGYIVEVSIALTHLAVKSLEAAKWFQKHVPADMTWFSFGPDEAIIVP